MTDGLTQLDKTKILVADDDAEIREFFMMAMKCDIPDCRIDLAVNGLEVIEAFRTVHYSIIVMDVRMPKMDGEEAYKEIVELCREENLEIPAFIFCTGFDPSDVLLDIVSSNLRNCILKKPVDPETLIDALQSRMKS